MSTNAIAKAPRWRGARVKHTTLYFAYGANTNSAAMAARCPGAIPHGRMVLSDHRLMFRGVADVVPEPGRSVFGALWWITPRCERSLDTFEGFPTLYTKEYGKVTIDGAEHIVMFYTMANTGPASPPYSSYEKLLRAGYADFGLPAEQIDLAIEEGPTTHHRFVSPSLGLYD